MKTVNLVLGVHNHQPVGNFEHVIEDAFRKAYLPFLEALERHPKIRLAIHNTGVLLDWFAEHHPDYLDRLHGLVSRGQVELLTGAYYEPILPVIPDHDKLGQIRLMNEEIQNRFGVRPRGMWLAERVWEPHLPRWMREAGVEFTALDDSHFKCAGLTEEQTLGYWITEEAGRSVAVFPINEKLRYTIPFRDPCETLDYLRSVATEDGGRLVVMIDDGEKFGVWPDTHRHCYQDGWIERFFAALEENASWIHLLLCSEALDRLPPLGRVYLPTASYAEMMEWALPADAIERYEDFVASLENRPQFEQERIFIRGGFWRNFLAKYDEANHMHKRMIRVSGKIDEALALDPRSDLLRKAQKALWRGQCNCAYWHGIFGGLYLTHLRSAVYRCLIEADALANESTHRNDDWIEVDKADFDCDGNDELLVETPVHILFFKPSLGGSLVEHDHVAARFNLLDTLARRKEGYHRRVAQVAREETAGDRTETGTASIHERTAAKETGLGQLLHYDWHRRACFLDHFIAPDTPLELFAQSRQREDGDFVNQPYECRCERRDNGVLVQFQRRGALYRPEGIYPLRVAKVFSIRGDRLCIDVEYEITNESKDRVETRFGVEFAFNFLAGDSPDRYYKVNGRKTVPANLASSGAHEGARRFAIVDEWLGLEARITPDGPMELWRFPIETVSVSEAGFERIYQGSVFLAHTLLELGPGESQSLGFRYEVLPWPEEPL